MSIGGQRFFVFLLQRRNNGLISAGHGHEACWSGRTQTGGQIDAITQKGPLRPVSSFFMVRLKNRISA
ncbi:hypothetical protein [Pseudomonas sp. Ma2-10]